MFSTKTLKPFLYSVAAVGLAGAVLAGCSDEEAKAPAKQETETAAAETPGRGTAQSETRFVIVTTIRRFWRLPSDVALSAIGCASPTGT